MCVSNQTLNVPRTRQAVEVTRYLNYYRFHRHRQIKSSYTYIANEMKFLQNEHIIGLF